MLPRPASVRLPRLALNIPLSRRHTRLLTVLSVFFVLFLWWPSPPLPPSFRSEWARERQLPQHEKGLPLPEGRHGRFVRFDVPHETPFPHYLQTVILQHHVAFAANRSLAFERWVKDETAMPFAIGRWPWRAASIPLGALFNVGSGIEILYDRPRAVSSQFYNSVCWQETAVTLTSEQLKSGSDRVAELVALLAGEEGCIRVHGDVFSDEWFESPAPVEAAKSLLSSPTFKHFSFAPAVLEIINRALPILAPSSEAYDLDLAAVVTKQQVTLDKPWKHMLALDVRHGADRSAECKMMSERFAPFVGFAKLPKLPGNENVPPPQNMPEPSRNGLYAAKCFPDMTAIIARARRMRKNHPLLRMIYVSTDAPPSWIEELHRWLLSDGWEQVLVGSRDVWSSFADRELGEAVDIEIARRSGVFVGNGFSSTGSVIAMLRHTVHPDFTQFW